MTAPAPTGTTAAAAAAPGTPAKPAKPKVNRQRAWGEAKRLMWEHRRSLTIGIVMMLVSRTAGFVPFGAVKYLVDEVVGKGRYELLTPLALAALGATVVQAITSYALSQVVSVAAQKAIADMRTRVARHVLRLPVRFFDATKSGVLQSRIMTDPEGIRNLVGTGLIQLTGGFFSAAIALGVLIWLNWQMTVITVVFLAIFGGAMAMAFKRLRPAFRERNEITSQISGRLTESIGGIRLVKVYVAEDREERIFGEGVNRLFRNIAGTITATSAVTALSTVVVGAVATLIIVMGGRAIRAGTMSLGDLVTYVFFIGLVAAPLVSIANIGTQISEAFAGLDRIRELLDTPTEDDEDRGNRDVPEVAGEVAFDDVWFEYEPGQPVLKGVTFRAPAGTTTALVGSSGSGKSTLTSLVMAFARPQRGSVSVDGRDLATVKLRDFRRHLGVVLQDNFLFDGTVRDNIGFTKPGATDEEIVAVSKVAHVNEFVERYPEKYDTIVGERGVKLSGGQRQRVAIARAILADPRILILDEATSSLDSESEAMIRDGLRRLRAGRTTFVIAHRLSTIESADQILVLEHGTIVERGTHAELLAMNGRYRHLYDVQHGVEKDRFVNPGEELAAV